jgi:putative FmdB family regulatory protein
MPIYEYRCEKCGVFEETQRITDPPLDRCPSCRRKVRRLISNTSFQLKGGGWYVTDYARGAKKGETGEKVDGAAASKDAGGAAANKDAGGAAESSPKKAETKGAAAGA